MWVVCRNSEHKPIVAAAPPGVAGLQRLRSEVFAASKRGNCHEAAIGQASIEPSM
jgi:hypothetical protein